MVANNVLTAMNNLMIKCIKNSIDFHYVANNYSIVLRDKHTGLAFASCRITGDWKRSSLECVQQLNSDLDKHLEVGAC